MATVNDSHLHALFNESAIGLDAIEARGYESVTTKARLKALGFAASQQIVPGLLIPVWNVQGDIASYQSRPDQPRISSKGKAVKYETPAGSRMILDVHPAVRHLLGDPSIPLVVTEGIKKGDALASKGVCAIALLGVWNFRGTNDRGGKTALPDWEWIALAGRRVYIGFDSDVMLKQSVASALLRLKGFLESRQADVALLYLPSGPAGAKQGIDDYLAAGHSVDDLFDLAVEESRPLPADNGADDTEGEDAKVSQATLLIQMCSDLELFHDDKGDAFMVIDVDGHTETWTTRSTVFRQWLARRFYLEYGKAPRSASITDALTSIDGRARFECDQREVHLRVASDEEGNIHIDLGDASWRSIKVTRQGWSLQDNCPVHFRRGQTTAALPEPQRGGSWDELHDLINVASEDDELLITGWLLGCLRPTGPYPILAFVAEQGSGKSSAARILRSLVDPSPVALGGMIREERDLLITARANHVLALDNVSSLPQRLSDALCRLATGGGWATRRLYTDADQEVFSQERPVLLTGIEDYVNNGDLMDRTILVNLPTITAEQRKLEGDIARQLKQVSPRIFGLLLDATSCALRNVGTVVIPALPRMADFAAWVTAAEPALGWAPGAFVRAYRARANTANEIILETSAIADLIRDLVAENDWQGTASELLVIINDRSADSTRRAPGFPKTARAVGNTMRRLAPNLRPIGVDVTFDKEKTSRRRRLILIRGQRVESTVHTVHTVSSRNLEYATVDAMDDVDEGSPTPNDAGVLLNSLPIVQTRIPWTEAV